MHPKSDFPATPDTMNGMLRLFPLILFLFLSLQSHAVTYRTCAQNFYPKFYLDQNTMRGYSVDIMKALSRIDKNIHFEGFESFCTIPRIEADILSGKKNVFVGAFKTPEREKKFFFLDIPLYTLKYVMVIRKDDTVKADSFENIRKLGNKGIILTLFGTALETFLQQQPGLHIDSSTPSVDANLRMLEKGRARFFFTVDLGLETLLNQPSWKNKFTILPTTFGENQQFIMVSKKMAAEDLAILSKSLKHLQTTGELARIFQSYKSTEVSHLPTRVLSHFPYN